MNHHHHHGNNRNRLWWAFWINFLFLIVELVGGIITGSLALLSDAGHMLTDVGALGLAIIVTGLAAKPPDERRTYGYLKTEILGAFINGATLVAICGFILWEALHRSATPYEIMPLPMLGIAILGLAANVISAIILYKGQTENINIKSAYLHLVSDALGSVGVVISALVIWIWNWTFIDILASVIIVGLILSGTWKMLLQSARMLIDSVPEGINFKQVRWELLSLPHVTDLHDLHIWSLGQDNPSLSAHIILKKECTDKSHWDQCLQECQKLLADRFGIHHTTIQIEPEGFKEPKNCS
ncbi:MAG: cation diffusion facilitator family transporter [Candidatus Marinimicrobia bacterium]|nr:cation diffusion facilitator family transporter [Candidatus Neomarinimicrobiota bacterium]